MQPLQSAPARRLRRALPAAALVGGGGFFFSGFFFLGLYLAPWAAAVTIVTAGIGIYIASLAWVGRAELLGLVNLLKNAGVIVKRGERPGRCVPGGSPEDGAE